MVTVNVVVLAGTVAAEPVERRMPSGDEVTEIRLSVPEAGKRLLPLPIALWHARNHSAMSVVSPVSSIPVLMCVVLPHTPSH